MAVRNRPLNSTMPFTVGHRKEPFAKGSNLEPGTGGKAKGSEDDVLCSKIPHLICKVWMEGTAKYMGNGQLHLEKLSSFIAQAECEGSQEFSPSSQERPYFSSPNCFTTRYPTEHNNVVWRDSFTERLGSQFHRSPRKHRRQRRRKQKVKKRSRERPRRLLGLPEQESSSPLQLTQKTTLGWIGNISGCSSSSSVVYSSGGGGHTLGVQETEQPDWRVPDLVEPSYPPLSVLQLVSSSSTQPWGSVSCGALPGLSYCSQESGSVSDSDFDCTLALQGLRGSVSQEDRCFAPSFFKEVERDARGDGKITGDNTNSNEGLLFHSEEKLQPNDYEYREGKDYSLLNSIQNGAYGDVYRVQDMKTSFQCAAKKVPLDRFRGEEVGTWSVLNSRRVVELFGAVREGPFVIFFMALKSGSVGKLLKERGRLPEDLALHYHRQVLEAIEDLQRKRVLHLDIKADNVLLSEDGRDTYLCDFGHSVRLDTKGRGTGVSSGEDFPGTESHMAPEVAKGEDLGTKADVWSSCCMLLHMLNGCPPWTRYYSHPLFLTIANKPPPVGEIPHSCSPRTAEVIKAGLVKDPEKRASAKELREKVSRALQEVGGLTSPIRGAYREPARAEPPQHFDPTCPPVTSDSSSSINADLKQVPQSLSIWREEACEDDEEEEEAAEGDRGERERSSQGTLVALQPRSGVHEDKTAEDTFSVSEQELQKLERDFYLSSLSQPYSPELQERLLSCLSSDYSSHVEPGDKDLGRCSVHSSDDLSSGVFSYNSQEGLSFGVDWLSRSKPPTPRCLEGVDVWIQNFDGRCLKIRETRKVKVGHIATGISEQISERAFSLETQDGRLVSPDEEVGNSGLYLRCTHALSSSGLWKWRVRDGVLDMRD
ncbi:mitogen-activated protein kinase kinase kinase 14-like [Scleropages formosus]|uniref:Mitogen-activated protein kinase kinase kinase 14a n=1 Tax=Scleropages formosus TaxID=113540 RepID=A0A8C9WAL5_SCLFO|nr:mitogen-activated protein kinase kinase kinase 14-like [Scleropages formosus]XP_029110208.1 mitogen-activated protein kinase kinase kinase 14-like [Scleropages formosus]XP_029110209.1 mitogen-activated protein kinase kinase kinase 14-like [Scleropages formosus]